ncbi:MAG: MarR family transcriptional regulator [Alphaproteobacteria bacterium]|nr:MAG: MarR family transcriptional regulator [Alphaproteobacteria bacterium]
MTDVKSLVPTLFLREDELRRAVELLFFAYRDFTAEADAVLARHGLGRAHHRALHFIGRQPGITVGDLLKILKITKQSLSRVLNTLVAQGYVVAAIGKADRRQRQLSLTAKGSALLADVQALQHARIADAYRQAGPQAVAGFWKVLGEIVNADERAAVMAFLDRG